VLYMMERHGWGTDEVRTQLAKGGGLAGLSGVAGGDVRDLEAAAAEGNRRAGLALEVFAYEVKKTIGAYAAAMGGLEAVAFTGASARTPPGCGGPAAKGWNSSESGWTARRMNREAETGRFRRTAHA